MVRYAALCLLLGSFTLTAQTNELSDRAVAEPTVCGPVSLQARMMDTSHDSPVVSQRVGIVLHNLRAAPMVLERIKFHFAHETPTSGAPLELETRVEVGGREQTAMAEQFTVHNPVSYVELTSVRYADGKIWSTDSGTNCKVVPRPFKE